jgi:transcriptional regulator with XRE-family HTH domain
MPRTAPVGDLLREWRSRRHRSQLDLAIDSGVSPRHLSFVETGRSKPSPELLLALAEHLEIPLRDRNALLLAAGYAPRFAETPLEEPAMDHVRRALQLLLDSHDPYPTVVVDREWNVVLANKGAGLFLQDVDPALLAPPINVYRLSLHPDGLAPRIENFSDWAAHLIGQLRRLVAHTADAGLAALLEEVTSYPNVAALPASHLDQDPELVLALKIRIGDELLSLFTTVTTLGSPVDVTLAELVVETFWPADAGTDVALRVAVGV